MSRARSLWPREHGAYAQLGVPLVTALALREPSSAAIAMAVGACLAFLANEPLLVVLGHRGERVRDALGPLAARRLAITGVGAALAGALGLGLASSTAVVVAGAVAVPAAAMIALAWARSAHTLWGELVAALALPGAAAPVAISSGVPWQHAAMLWLAWTLGYGASVIAVHEVLARKRRVWPALLLGVVFAGAACAVIRLPTFLVSLPLVGLAGAIAVRPPSPKRVRAIGVALVIASVASAALALAIG